MNTPQQGWECPKCKHVYAPFTIECFRCPAEMTATTTASTSFVDKNAKRLDPNVLAKLLIGQSKCKAERYSDSMVCTWCDLKWDFNDPDHPECNRPWSNKKQSEMNGFVCGV